MRISKPKIYAPLKINSLQDFINRLDLSSAEFNQALALSPSEAYEQKIAFKSDGTQRLVYKPHWALRRVQRRIKNRFFAGQNKIDWPDYIFGSIPNTHRTDGTIVPKDFVACASLHCKAKSVLKIDIKDFFDNIHYSSVENLFLSFFGFSPDSAQAAAQLCCREGHLTQGALTSSYIASLILHAVEESLVRRLRNKGLVYTRYVDDITVSSKASNFDFALAKYLIEQTLAESDLPINVNKTRILHISTDPILVHGLRICFKEPRLPSQEVGRIRAAVKNVETLAAEPERVNLNWTLNSEITYLSVLLWRA